MAPILPYILVVAVQLGIPVPLQGSLSAFSLLFTIVGKPVVAALADIFPLYRKALFLVTISIMVASFSAISFIPPLQKPLVVEGKLVRLDKFSLGNDSDTNAKIHARPLILAPDDNSDTYIVSGYECSFVCSHSTFCPTSTTAALLNSFTLEVVPDDRHLVTPPTNSQMVSRENSSVQRSPGTTDANYEHYSPLSGQLYILKGMNFSWSYLEPNVRLRCDKGRWNAGSGNQTVAWKSWQFWLLAVLLVVGQMAFNISVSITDAIAVDTVGDGGKYGLQRGWGTIGWGVMAPIGGLLTDLWSGTSSIKDYSPAFVLCFVVGAADVILSSVALKVPLVKDESNMMKNLLPLLKRPGFFVFCCFVVLNGCLDGIVVNYIFVMQEDMAKGTSAMNHIKFLQGLTLLVEGAVEAPFMFVTGWFFKRLGAQKAISLVFFLYIFRVLGLFLTGLYGSVWTTLVPELLNGPCYGLGYTAIVEYSAKITPPGTSNTVQSLINICYESLGYALSMFVGGLVYDLVGGPYMYLIFSGVAALTFVCHLISLRIFPPPGEKEKGAGTVPAKQEVASGDPEETKVLRIDENVQIF